MKKFFFAAMALMVSVFANAQNEVGQISVAPVVGINLSTLTKTEGSKMKFGIAAGAVAEYGVTEQFGVSVGLIYSQQGCKYKDRGDGGYDDYAARAESYDDYYDWYDYEYEGYDGPSGGDKLNLGYLNIPIMAQYYVIPGLALKAGIQPGVLVSAKSGSVKMKEYCNKFDVAIPVGASYEIANFVIDARYNIGLTKVPKKSYSDSKANNSVFQFTVGYKFKL
ncbi:MAG: PorT family protein [Bacteroidaceae bacterium]|nr:PorT family protein [Bacteroidaceae bacterium]